MRRSMWQGILAVGLLTAASLVLGGNRRQPRWMRIGRGVWRTAEHVWNLVDRTQDRLRDRVMR